MSIRAIKRQARRFKTGRKAVMVTAMAAAMALPGIASAAITIYDDASVVDGANDAATAPKVAPGGAVMAEYIKINTDDGTTPDFADGDLIFVQLPDGFSFASAPTLTTSGGVLVDDGVGGFTTTKSGDLVDTDNDGLDDRAVWTVKSQSAADDIVISDISVNAADTLTVSDTAADNEMKYSIGAGNAFSNTVIMAELVSSAAAPATLLGDSPEIQQTATNSITSEILVTVPAGTGAGETITLTPPDTVTLVVASVENSGKFLTDALAGSSTVGSTTSGGTVTLTINGDDLSEDGQIVLQYTSITTNSADLGELNLTLGGTAGVTGSVKVADVVESGTTNTAADFQTGGTPKNVVRGAANARTISDIVVTERFGDVIGSGKTFTIAAPAGVTFDIGSVSVTDTTATGTASVAVNAAGDTLTVTTAADAASSANAAGAITLSGIEVTVADTFTGDTIDLTLTDVDAGITGGVLTVANVVDPSVTITEPTTLTTIGIGSTSQDVSGTVLEEEYYGSFGTGESLTITAPAGVTINSATLTGVSGTLTLTDGDAGTAGNQAFVAPGGSSAFWTVEAESTFGGENTLTLSLNIDVDDTVAAGTDLVFTLSGVVDGTTTMATVDLASSATVADIPTVTPGDVNAQTTATLTLSELFGDALDVGIVRLIAPAGVTFATGGTYTGILSAFSTEVTTTFVANDTLLIDVVPTSGVDTGSVTPKVFVDSSASGMLSFQLVDGDTAGANLTGIVNSTVNLAYAGDVAALAGTASGEIVAGTTGTITITGGVAPYTAASADEAIATVEVTDDVVTVTGVAEGATTVTITDALGTTTDVAVTVTAPAELPALDGAATLSGGETAATFSGGVSADGGASYTDTFSEDDTVTVTVTINVDPADREEGEEGSIMIVAGVGDVWYMKDSDGNWQVWDGDPANLVAADGPRALNETEEVVVAENLPLAGLTGTINVFVGYENADGDIIYNTTPVTFTVEAAAGGDDAPAE